MKFGTFTKLHYNDLSKPNNLLKYSTDDKNADLNNYKTLGIYSIRSPKNYYHSNSIWCTILCIPTNYDKDYVLQIGYSSNHTNEICFRSNNNGTWTDWKSL